MNPFDSTLARLLLNSLPVAIATAIIQPVKSVARTVLKPILAALRRVLVVPPFHPDHPEAAADHLPVFTTTGTGDRNNKSVEWRKLVAGFCFTVGVGFLSVDSRSSRFPTPFMVISVLIALTFSFVLVSDFIRIKCPAAARVLEFTGLLSASAALFTALCIPLTKELKRLLWSLYAGTVVVLLVINFISASNRIHLTKCLAPDVVVGEEKNDLHMVIEIQSNINSTS